jgi:hypothetical protein
MFFHTNNTQECAFIQPWTKRDQSCAQLIHDYRIPVQNHTQTGMHAYKWWIQTACAAGAISDGETIRQGVAAGLSCEEALQDCDSYTYFDREGGLLRTGLTGTNVMDIHVVLCQGGHAWHALLPTFYQSHASVGQCCASQALLWIKGRQAGYCNEQGHVIFYSVSCAERPAFWQTVESRRLPQNESYVHHTYMQTNVHTRTRTHTVAHAYTLWNFTKTVFNDDDFC